MKLPSPTCAAAAMLAAGWTMLKSDAPFPSSAVAMRESRAIERRIKSARFPVLKPLDDFQWSWPTKINRPQIQNLFRLAFIGTKTNVILIGNVGLGKTHISIALGHSACQHGHTVLFTTAIDIINTLAAAQSAGRLKREFQRYLKPALLIIDELGYLPIDTARTCCSRSSASATSGRRGDHHQPRLQTLVSDLQQRQHLDLRHPRPRPASRRDGHHRRQELPHEGRDRKLRRTGYDAAQAISPVARICCLG
jgi:hypothetical protein